MCYMASVLHMTRRSSTGWIGSKPLVGAGIDSSLGVGTNGERSESDRIGLLILALVLVGKGEIDVFGEKIDAVHKRRDELSTHSQHT